MQRITNLGRWLFVLGMCIYVVLHFAQPDTGARFVPAWLPFPYFLNYATGVALVAFVLSALLGKFDRLAGLLLALYILLMAALVHVPHALQGTDPTEVVNIFRNFIAAGGALMFAGAYARDRRLPFGQPKGHHPAAAVRAK
ncbi:MAG: hypothetical protein H7Z21_20435 [Hymenobacter sp.]|nr:hypothetical protein [Hymenobacter sp.]